MKYLHFELHIAKGEVIQATLQQQSYLRLMDTTNYGKYRSGDQYSYHGGQALGSPAVIKPTNPGDWHLVIDLGGVDGEVKASVHIVKENVVEATKPKKGFFSR